MDVNKMKKASLAVELKEKADELAIKRASLLKNGVKVVLQSALERIELRQGDFTPLMIGKIQTKAIQNLTASILVDAAKSAGIQRLNPSQNFYNVLAEARSLRHAVEKVAGKNRKLVSLAAASHLGHLPHGLKFLVDVGA